MQRDDAMERLEAEIATRLQHDEDAPQIARDLSVSAPFVAAIGELMIYLGGE